MARDLSASGMLLYPQRRGNPGQQFRITFVLPTLGRWLDLTARLVRRTHTYSHRVGWAVQFVGVPSTIQRMLRRFVCTTTHTDSTPGPVPSRPHKPPAPLLVLRRNRRRARVDENSVVTKCYPRHPSPPLDEEPTRTASKEHIDKLLADAGD